MNIKKMIIGSLAASTIFIASVLPTFAAAFSNGSFDGGTDPGVFTTLNPGDPNITDWTVVSGSVDYIGTYWQSSPPGGRSVDLNGLTTGSVSQAFDTVVGGTYTVTFDLSGNPDSRADANDPYWSPSNKQVTVNATGGGSPTTYSYDTSVKGNSLSNMMWENHSYSFVATAASSTLSFTSIIPGAFGPALDNVVITEVLPTPTPTPTKDQCKDGGWRNLRDDRNNRFKNQGDCVSFFATQGRNLGAGGQ